MELDQFFPLLAAQQSPNPDLYNDTHFGQFLSDPSLIKIEEFADHLVVNLPSPRMDWYASTNYDEVQRNIVRVADSFVQTLGFYPVTAQMLILSQMEIFNMSILFLGLVFNVILLVFIVISVLLIYSLLMIGVETKAMETGIMRMMGTNKRGLVLMVAIQSGLFVMPAILTAFALSFPLIAVCYTQIFQEQLTDGFEPVPQPEAIL